MKYTTPAIAALALIAVQTQPVAANTLLATFEGSSAPCAVTASDTAPRLSERLRPAPAFACATDARPASSAAVVNHTTVRSCFSPAAMNVRAEAIAE